MRKSTLFISASLTTFMLVMLFGVVSAYQTVTGSNPINAFTGNPAVQQKPASGVADTVSLQSASVNAAPLQAVTFTAEQAAQLAAQTIGRTDLFSVETSKLNGADAYLVTFSSGDLVYVSLTGEILSITKLPVVTVSSGGGGGRRGGGGGSPAPGGDGEHEGGGGSD